MYYYVKSLSPRGGAIHDPRTLFEQIRCGHVTPGTLFEQP